MTEYAVNAMLTTWAQVKLVFVVYGAGLLLERLSPAQRGQPLRHIAFNLFYTVVFLGMTNLLVPPLRGITTPWIASFGGLIKIDLPATVPWQVLQALLFLFAYDFFYYWFHRAQHTFGWLWAQHRLHHSEASLNVTTGNRHHWLEEPIRVFVVLLPFWLLLDIQLPPISWIATGVMLWGYFIHMNLRLGFGPLTPVFGGPQLHRLHHSIEPQHYDRNFAAFFPIWDILFGTYCAPKRGEYPRTGLVEGELLNSTWRSSVSPFVDWWRGAAQWLSRVRGRNSRATTASRESSIGRSYQR
jgi:sterol desaturase/sphingolipid hydroxylase (fatty acid hydroxylase superfamily)